MSTSQFVVPANASIVTVNHDENSVRAVDILAPCIPEQLAASRCVRGAGSGDIRNPARAAVRCDHFKDMDCAADARSVEGDSSSAFRAVHWCNSEVGQELCRTNGLRPNARRNSGYLEHMFLYE